MNTTETTHTTRNAAPKPPAKLDPYVAVEKRTLWAPDSMRSAGHSVRIADPDEPTGWREVGVVGEGYTLVPNAALRDFALEVAHLSGLPFELDREHFDAKRFFLGLACRRERLVDVRVGDPVGLALAFRNSYDGSERLRVQAYVTRLACKNGMLSSHLFREVAFRHDVSGARWEEEAARALGALRSAEAGLARFAEAARHMTEMRLTAARLRDLRAGGLASLPTTVWAQALDRALLEEDHTLWGLLNGLTGTLWHQPRPTAAAFGHNEASTDALVRYALDHRN